MKNGHSRGFSKSLIFFVRKDLKAYGLGMNKIIKMVLTLFQSSVNKYHVESGLKLSLCHGLKGWFKRYEIMLLINSDYKLKISQYLIWERRTILSLAWFLHLLVFFPLCFWQLVPSISTG